MATESKGDAGPGSAEGRPNSKVSPVRNIIGLMLLVAFGGTAISEFLAYRGHASAVVAIQKLEPKLLDGPPKDKVEKKIGLATPAKLKDEGGERSATYHWRGLVRTYKIKAYYTIGDPPTLTRIDTE